MKYLVLSLILLLSTSTIAGGRWRFSPYEIASDTLNTSIPEGKCQIKGIVSHQGKPLRNALVGTSDNRITTRTNGKGQYTLLVSDADTSLYAFKSGKGEVIVDSYHFKSQHDVVINFFTRIKVQMYARKPVIYLYSKEDLDVEVDLDPIGELTFSYPKLENSWQVSTREQGIVHEGISYPYLFWESLNDNLKFQKSPDGYRNSYQINTDSVIGFLEFTLSKLGLNTREQTDFITYWGPEMMKHKYAFVQFIYDSDYSSEIAKINISPKPDASRRVFMYFAGSERFDEGLITYPIEMSEFTRSGLTLIEWGGSELKPVKEQF